MEAAGIAHAGAHEDHHGPPPAHRSSRVEPQLLGMLLFIISEVMVFGAFFTAYFFIRVAQGDPWPAPGTHLPVDVAGVNTAILMSSSFTMHWAQTSIKKGNRFGLKAGMLMTFLLGSALAGFGGLLGGAFLSLYPSADAEILVFSLAVVIIGGRGSLVGVGVGSLLVGLLNTFGQVMFPELAYFVIFGPMAALLAFRPLGLFGKAA